MAQKKKTFKQIMRIDLQEKKKKRFGDIKLLEIILLFSFWICCGLKPVFKAIQFLFSNNLIYIN